MQSLVVSLERFELESERNSLIEQTSVNERQLKEFEDDILNMLQNTDADKILDEDDVINKLANTNEESARIKRDQMDALARDKEIILERDK